MAKEIDYQKEAYYAVRNLAYQRQKALQAIDKVCNDPMLSPEEKIDQVSKAVELSGMKTDVISSDN